MIWGQICCWWLNYYVANHLFYLILLLSSSLLFLSTSADNDPRRSNKQSSSLHIWNGSCPLVSFETSELIYYQLNLTKDLEDANYLHPLDKRQHEEQTLALGSIKSSFEAQLSRAAQGICAYNLLISNRIGLSRRLPDTRNPLCHSNSSASPQASADKRVNYHHSGGATVIICHYNEPASALLRTLRSVLIRSPEHLVDEIILVDDHSDRPFRLSEPQIRAMLNVSPRAAAKVKLLRTNKREGLIRARLFGARKARGSVLVFLDSHIEANQGWLDPLMDAIREDKNTVACPMIDLINAETLIYSGSPMVRGGLTWDLHFKWDSIPSAQLSSYQEFVKPIRTATMAGGLYAIDRDYFYQLGAYDPGMDLWGGENIEMSLRIWMCGGKILILPCSRVGHIFRKKRPYGPAKGKPDSLLFNSDRAARVWLDQYIEHFYAAQPGAERLDSGNVEDRIELRKKLKCNNFTWFLDNIYPELKVKTDTPTSSPEPSKTSPPKLFKFGSTSRSTN